MNSVCISIEANEAQQDILIGLLSEAGADGFEQTSTHLLAWFNEFGFKSYEVNEVLKDYSFILNSVAEKNWNQEWERNFPPVVVDDFCAIRADFHDAVPDVEYEIVITPKMSFGTGHHATTYLMIRQMRALNFVKRSVFDFGTGTGILSILAEKMGAEEVVAIDLDEWSIRNAGENLERNHCSKISISLSSDLPSQHFDVILANINRNVILQYLGGLKKALSSKGSLLVSGILREDGSVVSQAAALQNLKLVNEDERGGWISQLYVNAD